MNDDYNGSMGNWRSSGCAADLERFYELLAELEAGLGGKRRLGDCDGSMRWPERGLYSFFEDGEVRAADPTVERVVRVGTHSIGSPTSKATLWGRLGTHRSGQHRASVYRKHVGSAIVDRDGLQDRFPQWGKGTSAPKAVRQGEEPMEDRVSDYLGRTRLLWLAVQDRPSPDSDRAVLEAHAIGLLTSFTPPIDPPSPGWLGHHCRSGAVRSGGLWNVQQVGAGYAPGFLDLLARYVDATLRYHGRIM